MAKVYNNGFSFTMLANKNKSESEMHLNVYLLKLKVVKYHSISDRNSHFSCQMFKLNKIV